MLFLTPGPTEAFYLFNHVALYAPVATHESRRELIAYSAIERKKLIEGADIEDAYLYRKLNVPIITEQQTNSSQQLKNQDATANSSDPFKKKAV